MKNAIIHRGVTARQTVHYLLSGSLRAALGFRVDYVGGGGDIWDEMRWGGPAPPVRFCSKSALIPSAAHHRSSNEIKVFSS